MRNSLHLKILGVGFLVATLSLLFVLVFFLPSLPLGPAQKAFIGTGFIILILVVLIILPLNRMVSFPVQDMLALAKNLSKGKFGKRIRVSAPHEASELAAAMNQMASTIESQITSLTEDRKRLMAILTGMAEGVLVLDRQGHILLTNPAMEEMFALVQSDILGRPFIEVIRHHRLNEFIKTILETRENRSEEMTMDIPDERIFWVQASTVKGFSNAGHFGAVLVFHNITPLKHLEKVRRDFVANVSHELRTPLTSIKGYIEALLDGGKDDPKQCNEFLQIVQKHTDRLNNIISDLLVLSEIESGRYHWRNEEVEIPHLVEKAVALVKPLAEKKNQTLTVTMREGIDPLAGDFQKLSLVLINLLDNAIKYTPRGGAIKLEAHQAPGMVVMVVQDTGLGIPKKDLSRIFERFYRVDRARSRELGGTGLGLSIVKHIIEAHGGNIAVESEIERGTTFTIDIPSAKRSFPK